MKWLCTITLALFLAACGGGQKKGDGNNVDLGPEVGSALSDLHNIVSCSHRRVRIPTLSASGYGGVVSESGPAGGGAATATFVGASSNGHIMVITKRGAGDYNVLVEICDRPGFLNGARDYRLHSATLSAKVGESAFGTITSAQFSFNRDSYHYGYSNVPIVFCAPKYCGN